MKHLYRYCPGVVLSIFMMCVALVGCVPEAIELPCRVRAIVTDSATNISVNEATLNAVVSLIDKDSIDCGVIYGANETLSSAKGTMVATAANGEYAVVVDKLKANTTYYYRAYALDAGMYKYGKVHSFKTDISVATGEATEITDCSAMLGGEVNSSDVQLSCGVIYSTSQENVTSTKDCVMASTTSTGVYAVPVTELKHATTYYYRAYAVMDGAYRYGEVRSFKTTLAVATGEATDVTPTSAKLNGALEGAENRTTCGFYYGTTETLDTESWTKLTTNSDGEFYKDLTDLKANTVYYYCAYAIIGGNYRYGEVCSFKTGVTITTLSAADVTATGATLKGWMNSSEAQLPCGFIYGTSSELSATSGSRVSTTANGDFTASIANLKDNTTYYYRAYVVVDGEYQYGKVLSFLTGYALTVTTNSASSITHNSVMISGKVTGAGKSVICGVIYSTESTLSSTSGSRVSTTANGSFTVAITGLNANTTYYYRAYAVSNGVYTYGEVSSFKTAANVTVTTGEATNVTGNSVTMNAAVSSSGQLVICGIVYNTTTSLSFEDGVKLSMTSKGAYSFYTANLQPNTTYYYRAYVSIGDTYKYGATRSFKTLDTSAISINKASSITENSATLNGTASGVTQSALCGIICGTSSTLTLTNAAKSYIGLGNGNFTWTITDLNPNTTYYYCYYILVDGVYKYGEVSSFTTEQEVVDNPSVSYETFTVNGVSFRMIDVEGGTFMMGSSDSDSEAYDEEKPAHQVTLSSYAIGETEVTQELWQAVMGSNPSRYGGEQNPVEGVSWNDCQEFISKLNALTGENFRLPTEAEWEYAARGGNASQGYKYSGSNTIDDVAWYSSNSSGKPHSVKLKKPNELGIYDMSGNVWEWCSDWYGSYSSSAQTNPTGPSSGSLRVYRGGSWYYLNARHSRVASRNGNAPTYADSYNGFRLVRSDGPLQMVIIETGDATDITADGATLSGTIVGASEILTCGFHFSTDPDFSTGGGLMSTISMGDFTRTLTGLPSGTTYYYKAFVDVNGEWIYGEVRSFTTKQEVVDNPSVSYETFTVNGVSFRMIDVEGGTFMMGAPDSDIDAYDEEKPAHQVTLSSYAIGETEVTQELWQAVMGSNPSRFMGDLQHPVEKVSWSDCQEFISKLNDLTGENFRLPTEAEWEFAARGGNASQGYKYSGSNTSSDVAWCLPHDENTTHPVKSLTPNELGIYDMSGNVWEWCLDWYGDYRSAHQTNPTGPSSGTLRTARGGSWAQDELSSRITYRHNESTPGGKWDSNGFRLVRSDIPLQMVTIATGEVTDITAGGATLSGVVTGADEAISCGIIYGTSSTMSSLNNKRIGTVSDGTYSMSVSYLQSGTTYYYCAYAVIDGEEWYGEVRSFTTEQDNIVDEPIVSNETFTVNGVSFTMISVEGGTFTMGATSEQGSDASDNEKPAHQVTLSSYAIGETEVTQALWQAVMGSNPSSFTGDLQRPVECVSWDDCQTFISKLNELTGENFRLPTEAEWEYAARGGKESNGYKYSGSNTIGDVAWCSANSSSQTHPVKTKQPNELGIYDMSGNVLEWCADWYGSYSSSAQIDPTGPSSGSYRVLRGGIWGNSARYCRVAIRDYSSPDYRFSIYGLRLVRQFIP